jgi:hypothetical protein
MSHWRTPRQPTDEPAQQPARVACQECLADLREPTDAMIKAGAAVLDEDWCSETNALNIWQAMVDEARK